MVRADIGLTVKISLNMLTLILSKKNFSPIAVIVLLDVRLNSKNSVMLFKVVVVVVLVALAGKG